MTHRAIYTLAHASAIGGFAPNTPRFAAMALPYAANCCRILHKKYAFYRRIKGAAESVGFDHFVKTTSRRRILVVIKMEGSAVANVEFVTVTAWSEFARPGTIAEILIPVVPYVRKSFLSDVALVEVL